MGGRASAQGLKGAVGVHLSACGKGVEVWRREERREGGLASLLVTGSCAYMYGSKNVCRTCGEGVLDPRLEHLDHHLLVAPPQHRGMHLGQQASWWVVWVVWMGSWEFSPAPASWLPQAQL